MSFTQDYYFGASALDPNRPRNVVFYGRVSTQHEAQIDALENQMQWYNDLLQYHPNWTVVDRYIDEGITGTLARKRPSFMRMLDDASLNKFDLIVTREVCRFARNTVEALQITRNLKGMGVEVYFVSDNIWTIAGDGELRLSLMATLAQEESRKISERVRAGQESSRKKGVLYGNGNIIGYDRVNGTYVINEKQAESIRTVYRLYSQGMGEKKIVSELTRLGCVDGNGKANWCCSKVSRILRNATYMGYICYNKSKVKDYVNKERINNLDEDSYIYVKGDFEPIVSEELWHECQHIRKNRIATMHLLNGEVKRKGIRESKSVWVRKLRCRCGYSFAQFRWNVLRDGTVSIGFQCARRSANPSSRFVQEHQLTDQDCCDMIAINRWRLEMMGKMVFQHVWGKNKPLILRTCQMAESCSQLQKSDSHRKAMDLHQKREAIAQRKLQLGRMRADGDLEHADYRKLMAEANRELKKLTEEASQPDENPEDRIDTKKIREALEQVLDLSGPSVSDELLEEFVEVITPVENYKYRWKLNFGPPKLRSEVTNMVTIQDEPILTFTIDYEMAYAYRKQYGMALTQFHRSTWHDLEVEVYL